MYLYRSNIQLKVEYACIKVTVPFVKIVLGVRIKLVGNENTENFLFEFY